MRPNITIAIPTPYLPIDEYCQSYWNPYGNCPRHGSRWSLTYSW